MLGLAFLPCTDVCCEEEEEEEVEEEEGAPKRSLGHSAWSGAHRQVTHIPWPPSPTIWSETDFCLLASRQSISVQGSSQGWGGEEATDKPTVMEAHRYGGEEGEPREYAEWEGLQMAWSRLTEDITLGRCASCCFPLVFSYSTRGIILSMGNSPGSVIFSRSSRLPLFHEERITLAEEFSIACVQHQDTSVTHE